MSRSDEMHAGMCVGGEVAGRYHSSPGRNLAVAVMRPIPVPAQHIDSYQGIRGPEMHVEQYRWLHIHEGIGCWVHESLIVNPDRLRDGVLTELLANYHPPVVR